MRRARAPRPLSIRLFALGFPVQALCDFVHQMRHLEAMQAFFAHNLPDIAFDRDLTIATICARLSIALIPVALLWFFAARWVRWILLATLVARLAALPNALAALPPGTSVSLWWLGSILLATIATCLLFVRGSARWLADRGTPLAGTFD